MHQDIFLNHYLFVSNKKPIINPVIITVVSITTKHLPVKLKNVITVWMLRGNMFAKQESQKSYNFLFHNLIKKRLNTHTETHTQNFFYIFSQQFGKILDVEIIFNERGSKVHTFLFIFR